LNSQVSRRARIQRESIIGSDLKKLIVSAKRYGVQSAVALKLKGCKRIVFIPTALYNAVKSFAFFTGLHDRPEPDTRLIVICNGFIHQMFLVLNVYLYFTQ